MATKEHCSRKKCNQCGYINHCNGTQILNIYYKVSSYLLEPYDLATIFPGLCRMFKLNRKYGNNFSWGLKELESKMFRFEKLVLYNIGQNTHYFKIKRHRRYKQLLLQQQLNTIYH